jgi:hypothetical protein
LVTELLARPQTTQTATAENPTDSPNRRRHDPYRLLVPDALLLCWAVYGAVHLVFRPGEDLVGTRLLTALPGDHLVGSAILAAVWMAARAVRALRAVRPEGGAV